MIRGIRLPIEWTDLGLPAVMRLGSVTLWSGPRAWAWAAEVPDLGLRVAGVPPGAAVVDDVGLDHVVLLVPDLAAAAASIATIAGVPRRRATIRGRDTAFWIVGTLLEVVEESSVERPLLYGVSLETTRPLESVATDWGQRGIDVSAPRPAFQPGRRIVTARGLAAGLAVMSPRRTD